MRLSRREEEKPPPEGLVGWPVTPVQKGGGGRSEGSPRGAAVDFTRPGKRRGSRRSAGVRSVTFHRPLATAQGVFCRRLRRAHAPAAGELPLARPRGIRHLANGRARGCTRGARGAGRRVRERRAPEGEPPLPGSQ